MTIPFYEKCGFIYSHSIKNFFTDNYDHPIYEAGTQLIDMIYLQKKINPDFFAMHLSNYTYLSFFKCVVDKSKNEMPNNKNIIA